MMTMKQFSHFPERNLNLKLPLDLYVYYYYYSYVNHFDPRRLKLSIMLHLITKNTKLKCFPLLFDKDNYSNSVV